MNTPRWIAAFVALLAVALVLAQDASAQSGPVRSGLTQAQLSESGIVPVGYGHTAQGSSVVGCKVNSLDGVFASTNGAWGCTGSSPSPGGSAGTSTRTGPPWQPFTTAAAQHASAGWLGASGPWIGRMDWGLRCRARIGHETSAFNGRVYLALTPTFTISSTSAPSTPSTSTPGGSGVPTFAGAHYLAGASGGSWYCCAGDGTEWSCSSAFAAHDENPTPAGDEPWVEVDWRTDGQVTCSVGETSVTHSTTVAPHSTAANLRLQLSVHSNGAYSRQVSWSAWECERTVP